MGRKSVKTTTDQGDKPVIKKPRQSATSRVRGKRGALSKFLAIPLDLIYEICTHLDVASLLALSNTTKSLRSVVTGNASAGLWKTARASCGLPELEDPMSDLAYAALLFGKGCNFCDRKNAGKPDPALRARLCAECFKKKLIARSAVTPKYDEYATSLCHSTVEHYRNGASYHLGQIRSVSDKLAEILPEEERKRSNDEMVAQRARARADWWDPMMEDFLSDEEIEVERERKRAEQAAPKHDHSEFTAWYTSMQEKKSRRARDTQKLEMWINNQKANLSASNDNVRHARHQEISRRLSLLGFSTDELSDHQFLKHPVVSKPAPISDRTWSTKVQPVLVAVLYEVRKRHRRIDGQDVYYRLRDECKDRNTWPPIDVFLQLPSLHRIINDLSSSEPLIKVFDNDANGRIKATIVEEAEGIMRNRREGLLRKIVKVYNSLKASHKVENDIRDRKMVKKARKEEKGKMKEKSGGKGKGKEEEEEKVFDRYVLPADHPRYTNLDRYEAELPRLPPWIPRSSKEPLTASNEQLAAFLDTSPLAQVFECIKCHSMFDHSGIIDHLSRRYGCGRSRDEDNSGVSELKLDEWFLVSGRDSMVRLDAGMLELSLKMAKLMETVDLVVPLSAQKWPADLRLVFTEPNYDDDRSYEVKLRCHCAEGMGREPWDWYSRIPGLTKTVREMLDHLFKDHLDDSSFRVRAEVSYARQFERSHNEKVNNRILSAREVGSDVAFSEDDFSDDFSDDENGFERIRSHRLDSEDSETMLRDYYDLARDEGRMW